ncbi:MAG: hypothetical protein P8Y97_21565, partial [Candidatus Lokiarchaeota archaeon]
MSNFEFKTIEDVRKKCENVSERETIKNLTKKYDSKEIIEVINLLSDLKGIDLPIELENLQEFQNSIGAGFHG